MDSERYVWQWSVDIPMPGSTGAGSQHLYRDSHPKRLTLIWAHWPEPSSPDSWRWLMPSRCLWRRVARLQWSAGSLAAGSIPSAATASWGPPAAAFSHPRIYGFRGLLGKVGSQPRRRAGRFGLRWPELADCVGSHDAHEVSQLCKCCRISCLLYAHTSWLVMTGSVRCPNRLFIFSWLVIPNVQRWTV